MKPLILTLSLLIIMISAHGQKHKAIFLHHSTGGAVYFDGAVEQWISDYNTNHSTDYSITEFSYPNTPWGWENYPYDFWKLWVDGSCNNPEPNIQCLDKLCNEYELVIFKHCFPGAAINTDSGDGEVTSQEKTLANYKLQYRALLNLMGQYPDNKFMVWTLAPLHRNATSPEQAQLAGQFADWVKNSWLNEDGKNHSNVRVFDFFGNTAELSATPSNGIQYCLKYDYEGDHNGSDSHPNSLANQTIGPIFAQEVVNFLAATTGIGDDNRVSPSLKLSYNTSSKSVEYKISGINENVICKIELFSILGQKIRSFETTEKTGNIAPIPYKGVFVVHIIANGKPLSGKIAN